MAVPQLVRESEEAKAKGNDAFLKKDYKTALTHYSTAILKNPKNHVLYSNRSACHLGLAKFEDGLKDAETCIDLDPNWGKAYLRKADCLLPLKRYKEAQTAYEKFLEYDPTNEFGKKGAKESEIKGFYEKHTEGKNVEVKFISETIGKGLFATRHINKGQVLFREKPLVWQQWTRNKMQTLSCAHCMKFLGPTLTSQVQYLVGEKIDLPLESSYPTKLPEPIKRTEETGQQYCSEKCKEDALVIHKIFFGNPNGTAQKLIAHAVTICDRFVLAAQVIVKLVYDMIKQNKTKEEVWHPFSLFTAGSWLQLIANQKLGTPEYKATKDYLEVNRKISHDFLKQILLESFEAKASEFFRPDASWFEFTELHFFDKVLGIFELNNPRIEIHNPLHEYFAMIHSNDMQRKKALPLLSTLVGKLKEKHGEEIPNCEGHGLFTLHSCINHSCEPNAKQDTNTSVRDAEVLIVATRDIEKGEEIFIKYITLEGKSRAARQKELFINYNFACTCTLCKTQK